MDAKVSIVMAEWNRRTQLEKTLESIHAQNYPNLEIVCVTDCRKRTRKWMNPAPLLNQAIRASTGDILIIQNPECLHVNAHAIRNMANVCQNFPATACFAAVEAMDANGEFQQWYCHPAQRPVPWFFCGAIPRHLVIEAGMFNEDFKEYGVEDKDFAERLIQLGVNFEFLFPREAHVHHQWHGYPEGMWENAGA